MPGTLTATLTGEFKRGGGFSMPPEMEEEMSTLTADEKARQARREYQREYKRKHREQVKRWQRDYWAKRYDRTHGEAGESDDR